MVEFKVSYYNSNKAKFIIVLFKFLGQGPIIFDPKESIRSCQLSKNSDSEMHHSGHH